MAQSINKKRTGLKRKSVSTLEKLRKLRELFNYNDHLLILINPDPDSIASAMALKRILWKRVQGTTLAYIGEINRLENQTMVDLLKIPMVGYHHASLERYTKKALIDSQPHHHELFRTLTYDVIIDHHPVGNEIQASFVDIQPDYGATATLMTEYLIGAKIDPSARLSTALLYAIKVDTNSFERDATEEDVKQFRFLFNKANLNILRKIEHSDLRFKELRYFQLALEGMRRYRKRIYTHLGEVKGADICVQVAEFFLRVHDIAWIVVSGVYKNKLIIILRNDGYRKDAGVLASKAFSTFGHAGGHKGAARAEIPLEVLKDKIEKFDEQSLSGFIREQLKL